MLFERQPALGHSQKTGPLPLTEHSLSWLDGTDRLDLSFVYHHLRKGCILQLQPTCSFPNVRTMHVVTYGSYRLGFLRDGMARQIIRLGDMDLPYRLTIARIVKEKYLPPTAIQLELEWARIGLASNTNEGLSTSGLIPDHP